MRHAYLMAGGSGTRLWPLTGPGRPKPLVDLPGIGPLLRRTWERLDGVVAPERRTIGVGASDAAAVRAAFPEIRPDRLLVEPDVRDTLNALALAAAVLAAEDPDAVFAALPADHLLEPNAPFAEALRHAFDLLERGDAPIVLLALEPERADPALGYITLGAPLGGAARRVDAFIEKPPVEEARRLIVSGRAGWNSGVYLLHARALLDLLRRHRPENAAGIDEIARAWPTPDRDAVLRRVYPTLPPVSIDLGLTQPVARDPAVTLAVVPLRGVRWSDVGTFAAVADAIPPDEQGHRTAGRALHLDSRNLTVISDDPDHLVATIGCEGLVVVHTAHATLVCPADQTQRVKKLVERLHGSSGNGP